MDFPFIHILGEHVSKPEEVYGVISLASDDEFDAFFDEPSIRDDIRFFLQERQVDTSALDFSSKQAFLNALKRVCPHQETERPIDSANDARDLAGTRPHLEQITLRMGEIELFTVDELKDFLYAERDNGEMIDDIVESLEDIINFVKEKEPDGDTAQALIRDDKLSSSDLDPRARFQLLLNDFGVHEAQPQADPSLYIDAVKFRVCIYTTKKDGACMDVSFEYKVKHVCSFPLILSLVSNKDNCVWSEKIQMDTHDSALVKRMWPGIPLPQLPSSSLDDCFHLSVHIEARQYEAKIYRRLSEGVFAAITSSPDIPLGDPILFGVYRNADWFKEEDVLVVDSITRIGRFNERGITWLQQAGYPHLRWIDIKGVLLNPFSSTWVSGYQKGGYAVLKVYDWYLVINKNNDRLFDSFDSMQLFADGFVSGRDVFNSKCELMHADLSNREEVIDISSGIALVRKTAFLNKSKVRYYYYNCGAGAPMEFSSAQPFVDGRAVVKCKEEYSREITVINKNVIETEEPIDLDFFISDVRYLGHNKYSVKSTPVIPAKDSDDIPLEKYVFFICAWEEIRHFDPSKQKRCFEEIRDNISENYVAVKSNGKWGFYYVLKDQEIDSRFDEVGDFDNGFAKVKIGGKWGFIDTSGQIVINCEYDEVQNVYKGVYAAKKDGVWCIYSLKYNLNGWYGEKIPIPFTYQYIGRFAYDVAPVLDHESNREGWGMITTDGYPLIPYEQNKSTQETTSEESSSSELRAPEWDPYRDGFGMY